MGYSAGLWDKEVGVIKRLEGYSGGWRDNEVGRIKMLGG